MPEPVGSSLGLLGLLGFKESLFVDDLLDGDGVGAFVQFVAGEDAFVFKINIHNVLTISFFIPLQDHPDIIAGQTFVKGLNIIGVMEKFPYDPGGHGLLAF